MHHFDYTELVLWAVGAAATAYGLFLFVLKVILPSKLRRESLDHKKAIIRQAEKRANLVLAEKLQRAEIEEQDNLEDLEEKIRLRQEDLEASIGDLDSQEEFASKAQSRIDKRANEIRNREQKIETFKAKADEKLDELLESKKSVIKALEVRAQASHTAIVDNMVDDLITSKKLECQKVLKNLEDEVSLNARKLATRYLARVEARYAPSFSWPKPNNNIEITSPKILEALESDQSRLLQDLREMSDEVSIEIISKEEGEYNPFVKLVGGFGPHREAARATLEELIGRPPSEWAKANQIFVSNMSKIESQALKLGQKAVRDLKLDNVHIEIQKMVGYLNWRTSYRQNQYLHTYEVATLAGILAHELGVDPDAAKRCGLMHDIGKTLDYKIEGSHAVISGDYADRYGESRLICDTCMSHHNDLVLETALSYVLKTADTLSGARPGARVNLEEGYQIRLTAIDEAVRSFPGIAKVAIMNGGREVHVDVHHAKVKEEQLGELVQSIARKIEADVAYPGQIKVMVTRRYEATSVA